jgi:hypothetical protein
MGETRRLYQGGKRRSKAAKARRAAAQPKPRTQTSKNKEAAGRKAYAERGSTKKTKKDKRADKKATKTQKKKAKKAKKAKKGKDQGKGGPGSSGFNMPSLPDLPELPEMPELPGGPDLSNGFGNSTSENAGEPESMGAEAESAEEAAAADQAAADSVDPADFGAQPPPYNAETCENQTNYESEKCLAVRNSRAFRDPLLQEFLKVPPDNVNTFFEENAEAIVKAYNEIGNAFQECLQTVEAKKGDCLACANGDQSKCPQQGATAEGGTRRPRFKTHRRRRCSRKKI